MVTLDDIAAAVRARCDGSAPFTSAVPGKAWHERVEEGAAAPYALFNIERDGQPEFQSDGSFVQAYTVRMAVYSDADAGPQAAQLAMAAALNADPTGWAPLRAGSVMHCLPRGYDGKFDPKLRAAQDVFVSGGQWALLIEGNAGA